ncbi:MAG: sulfatase-like hydrolase/transferase [Oscillospiraceae bacterium]
MMKKPNIVFYFADQQRWDTLGCMGQKLDVTPNIDELAKSGTLFENAFTCQPVCGPARACLQTGRYATEVGCHINGIAPQFGNVKMLAEYFNEADYRTAYVGKWHLATDMHKGLNYETAAIPHSRRGGYKDYWMAADVLEFTSHGYNGYVYDENCEKVNFTGYRADCINNYAIDFVQKQSEEKPFFLFVSQIEPHHQNDDKRFEGPCGSKEKFCKFTPPGDLVGKGGDWQENYPDYLGACHSLDENLGRLVTALKDKGLWENTILFYTADHGSHFRTRNSEYKRSCHDASIHIPLLVVGGCFNTGRRVKNVVSLIDLPTTLLDCAGIEMPKEFKGRSLCELAENPTMSWDNTAFLQISESQVGRAIRTERYTYSVRGEKEGFITDVNSDVYYEDFLYDDIADVHQQNNLVNDFAFADVRKALSEKLAQKMREANEELPNIKPITDRNK